MLLRTIVAFTLFMVLLPANAAYRNNIDLISLHYDHAPDRDDGHATVAAFMMASKLGIQPHVVSGTYGEHNDHRYQPLAEQVMQAVWGNNWLNAHSDWQNSVDETVALWIQTIEAGGDIYVAEGGQADFTADVVREIRNQTSIETKNRIAVVQHSDWNETMANASDLAFVKAQTDYIKIDDGNHTNTTADLNKRTDSFVALAISGQFSSEWNAAFDYLSPSDKLDFSDTVELLYILDVGKDIVATIADFGDEYFGDTPAPIVATSGPQAWSDSYSVGGQCYCDSTFDHGLQNTNVSTPGGSKSVPQICSDISATFGSGATSGRVYYNTVQCGYDPKNNAADEEVCPGIPISSKDYSGPNCNDSGATWNLDTLYSSEVTETPVETPTETPVETPTETPVETPTETPVETPTETPVETIIETPTEVPAESNETAVLALEFPACSIHISDDNQDGYGWENNQTCTVDSQTTIPQSPTEIVTFPTCSAAVIDDNDDGYGWESNRTCEITASTSITPDSIPASPETQELAACFAAAVDTDRDGDAWEDNHTCVVTTDSTPFTPLPLESVFPECSTQLQDADGDGYGWENNQTCSFTATDVTEPLAATPVFPVCSDTTLDVDGDGYSWEDNQTCEINHQPQSNSTDNIAFTFPSCSTAIPNPNGDEYGWENNQTCAFTTDDIASESAVTLLTFPQCSISLVDEDADGYGWENQQTCSFIAETPQLGSISFPACSDAITDTSGDGYSWENNQSCYFVQSLIDQNQGAFTQPTLTFINFPICSSAIQDNDFTGYGWENNQSCLIQNNVDQTDQQPLAFVTFPICSSHIIDNDGNGYGWENNYSCAIGQTTTLVDEESATITIAGTIYPVCVPTAIDDNYDGFVWENDTTCIVSSSIPTLLELSEFPTCTASVVDETLDGYGWENNRSCRIVN